MQPRLLVLVLLSAGCHSDVLEVSASADASEPELRIEIPVETVDCADVLLGVVGARRAALGEHIVLQASASGLQSSAESDEGSDTAVPTLLWAAEDLDLTVTGPGTADILCGALGSHNVNVGLAPPAPCPSTLDVAIECFEPSDS